jgi:dTDP-4-dehydrorhamnose 3,5-epimerase
MIFTETSLKGAFIIDLERMEDERGFFARSFCQEEFRAHELKSDVAQCNVSFNERKGTLRGMHRGETGPLLTGGGPRCDRRSEA